VLVVDDERSIRLICRANLEAAGMVVLEANDGASALTIADAERPSLILLDVMLPGVDGWEVARKLGARKETKEIPVIFLTARVERDDRLRAHALGAVGYLAKPFDPTALAEVIEVTLQRVQRGERETLAAQILEAK